MEKNYNKLILIVFEIDDHFTFLYFSVNKLDFLPSKIRFKIV